MENFNKGKIFMVFLLLGIRVYVIDCNLTSNDQEIEEPNRALDVLDRQEIQLKKLEILVKNLTDFVARLESSCGKVVSTGSVDRVDKVVEVGSDRVVEEKPGLDDVRGLGSEVEKNDEIGIDNEVRVGGVSGVSVTKYNPAWSERFQFLSAVKLESEATCISVLPFEDFEGFSKYIAVGDEQGKVYVFAPNGDVLIEFRTLSESPITSMLSYLSVHKNESVLVTGHENGVILIHQILEISNGEDWHSLSMENLQSFDLKSMGEDGSGSSVTILEVLQVGRMRYILSSDVSGKIKVLRENGTVYGSAMAKSRPLAFMKQRLLFLTENGAGSLDLRNMKIKESECEGMNHSLARNYVFDVSERSKAYGFTAEGDLIHVVLLGDITNLKCRLRSKRKFEMDGPLLVQAIKGYLLVVSQEKVFVYNISSQHYIRVGAPRPLFSASLDEIKSSFLNAHVMNDVSEVKRVMPLIASDHEKLVVLGLGSGYVGMYRSNLPLFNTEFNSMFWTSPVLLFLLFLVGAWHFFGKKKEALTSWGSDDPFTPSSGAMIGTGVGERPFADSSSRSSDLRDLRGGALRGPTRRYGSPSRFPGGAAIPFRPSTSDPNFRTSPSDHNFRAATDLKYRGPGLEPTGFPKRRDIFPNNQAVEDNIDAIN